MHQELNEEIEKLEESKQYYKEQIDADKEAIKKLNDSFEFEKFAREEYYMKRKNEDIYIIEYEENALKEEENE